MLLLQEIGRTGRNHERERSADRPDKTHERVDVSYGSKSVILTKGLGILLFTGILFALIPAALVGWLTAIVR